MRLDNIDVSAVIVPEGRRRLNPDRVREISASIEKLGLLQPIIVREEPEGYRLIAGRHRLAAVERLEWPFVDAFLFKGDEVEQRLAEISENLHRSDLTALERDEQVAEWIRLTEARDASQTETHRKAGQQPGGINGAARTLDLSKADAHRAMKVASLSTEAKEAARDAGLDNNRTALLAAAKEKEPEKQVEAVRRHAMQVMTSSESSEWYSPPHIVEIVTKFLGAIDLDPCWHPDSPVSASTTFVEADNGLSREWRGKVYLNPPYGREIDGWIEKLVAEYERGNVTEAIALLKVSTDTSWFSRLDAFPRCFVTGRLAFGGAKNSAPFPSAIVYLGPRVETFAWTFASLGTTFIKLAPQPPAVEQYKDPHPLDIPEFLLRP